MAGLQAPLSTLRPAPRGALRMTQGQSGLLFFHCQRLSLFALRRSPGALLLETFTLYSLSISRRTSVLYFPIFRVPEYSELSIPVDAQSR